MPSTSRLVSQTLTLNLAVLQQSLKWAEKACWQFPSYKKICLCVNFPPNQDFLQMKSPPDNQIAWWRNVGFTWLEKQHTKVKSLCIQILFIEVYISNLSTKKTSPPAPQITMKNGDTTQRWCATHGAGDLGPGPASHMGNDFRPVNTH